MASAIGQRFTESVPLNLERAWGESRPRTPLICLLSPGGQGWAGVECALLGIDTPCPYLLALQGHPSSAMAPMPGRCVRALPSTVGASADP